MSASTPQAWWRLPAEPAQASEGLAGGRIAFGSVLLLLFVMVLAPQGRLPALAPYRIALLTAGVAVVAYVAERWNQATALFDARGETGLTLLLLGWALVTAPFSYWPGGTIAFITGLFAKTLVLFWLLAHAVNTPRRVVRTAWAMALMAIPLAATALDHFRSGDFVRGGQRIAGYESGLTANPNDLALMLNLILPLTLGLLFMGGGILRGALLLGCVVLDVAAIIVTFSRAGFLTLACTAGLMGSKALRRPLRGWVLFGMAAILLGLPLMPRGYMDRLSTITDINSDPTGSAQARWADTQVATRYVLAHPLIGSGAGLNDLALNGERGPLWKEVHNAYLEYAVELGLPGLLLFTALFAVCLADARRVARSESRDLAAVAEGVEVSLWAFAVAALFQPVGYQFYFYWLAGLAVALRKVHETVTVPQPATPEAATPWWSAAGSPLAPRHG